MAEEWRDVVGFEGKYQVSSEGRLKRLPYHRKVNRDGDTALVPYRISDGFISDVGYRRATLGRGAKRYIHQLVCEAFHGPAPKDKPNVSHYDGDKLNNRADNLRWANQTDNGQDAIRLREMAQGEAHVGAILKEKDIIEIRKLHASGDHTMRAIGRRYGICHQHVGDIIRRRIWKHV